MKERFLVEVTTWNGRTLYDQWFEYEGEANDFADDVEKFGQRIATVTRVFE